MTNERIVTPLEGYGVLTGTIATLLVNTRVSTISLLDKLTVDNLDFKNEFFANSIAKLAMHIAALEKFYYYFHSKLQMPTDETMFWKPFFSGELAKVGNLKKESSYYVKVLKETHSYSLKLLKENNDQWLVDIDKSNQIPYNHLFYIFHRLEDEIRHQGQIRLIVKALYLPEK